MLKSGRAPDFRDRDYAKKSTAIAVKPRQGVSKTELDLCDLTISNSLTAADNAFAMIARTVARVKEQELWRQGGYSSFTNWCEQKHGWSRQRGYQIADGHMVLQGISNEVSTTLLTNEGQTRALKAAPVEQRSEVIREVAETGPLTAKRIAAAVAKRMPVVKVIDIEPAEKPEKSKRVSHCPTCGQRIDS